MLKFKLNYKKHLIWHIYSELTFKTKRKRNDFALMSLVLFNYKQILHNSSDFFVDMFWQAKETFRQPRLQDLFVSEEWTNDVSCEHMVEFLPFRKFWLFMKHVSLMSFYFFNKPFLTTSGGAKVVLQNNTFHSLFTLLH